MGDQYVQLFFLGPAVVTDPGRVAGRIAEIGFAGVEAVLHTGTDPAMLAMLRSHGVLETKPSDVPVLRKALDEQGLTVPSCHGSLPEGAEGDALLDEVAELGAHYLIVAALLDPGSGSAVTFGTRDQVSEYAERFAAAAEKAATRGITLGYHNHFWEFGTDATGWTGLEAFFAETDPRVVAEVDLYWARIAGQDPAALLPRLGERVHLVHVKDGGGKRDEPSCALGEGVMELAAALAAAPRALRVIELEGIDNEAVWPALEKSHAWLATH